MEENGILEAEPLAAEDRDEALSGDLPEGENKEEAAPVGNNGRREREEYERLIKDRFKDFYAEDTQRLINRRFRKYKVMEERFKIMEDSLAEKDAEIGAKNEKIAEFEDLLRSEIEKAIKETEERIIGEIKLKKLRPGENGAERSRGRSSFDVSRLTKKDRAALAKRAAGGEKIKL